MSLIVTLTERQCEFGHLAISKSLMPVIVPMYLDNKNCQMSSLKQKQNASSIELIAIRKQNNKRRVLEACYWSTVMWQIMVRERYIMSSHSNVTTNHLMKYQAKICHVVDLLCHIWAIISWRTFLTPVTNKMSRNWNPVAIIITIICEYDNKREPTDGYLILLFQTAS